MSVALLVEPLAFNMGIEGQVTAATVGRRHRFFPDIRLISLSSTKGSAAVKVFFERNRVPPG